MLSFPSHDKFTHEKKGGSHLVFSVQETWLLVICFNIHIVTSGHSLWLLAGSSDWKWRGTPSLMADSYGLRSQEGLLGTQKYLHDHGGW